MSYLPRHTRFRRTHAVIVALSIGSVATACSSTDEPASSPPATSSQSPVELVSPGEFDTFLADNPDAALINVHIPYEDHIDGTDAFIAFDSILESTDLPSDRSAPIALYCRSGNMSGQASADLAAAGYTNVVDLEGGMNAWETGGKTLLDDPSAVDG